MPTTTCSFRFDDDTLVEEEFEIESPSDYFPPEEVTTSGCITRQLSPTEQTRANIAAEQATLDYYQGKAEDYADREH